MIQNIVHHYETSHTYKFMLPQLDCPLLCYRIWVSAVRKTLWTRSPGHTNQKIVPPNCHKNVPPNCQKNVPPMRTELQTKLFFDHNHFFWSFSTYLNEKIEPNWINFLATSIWSVLAIQMNHREYLLGPGAPPATSGMPAVHLPV